MTIESIKIEVSICQTKMIISNQVRSRSVMEGMRMEAITIDGWLSHIESMK